MEHKQYQLSRKPKEDQNFVKCWQYSTSEPAEKEWLWTQQARRTLERCEHPWKLRSTISMKISRNSQWSLQIPTTNGRKDTSQRFTTRLQQSAKLSHRKRGNKRQRTNKASKQTVVDITDTSSLSTTVSSSSIKRGSP